MATTVKRKALISRAMRVAEIIAILPDAEPLVAQYGLHCFHCSANAFETLEEGCRSHGFTDEDIGDLVTDLNELLVSRPSHPQTLTITLPAARALLALAKKEGRIGQMLEVGVDESGGFCMEFRETPATGGGVFFHASCPTMRLSASTLTLQRIGGATIDFRDERFKLDLPEDRQTKTCGCGNAAPTPRPCSG